MATMNLMARACGRGGGLGTAGDLSYLPVASSARFTNSDRGGMGEFYPLANGLHRFSSGFKSAQAGAD